MNKPEREGFVTDEPVDVDEAKPAAQPSSLPKPELEVEEWPITVKLLHKPIRNTKGEQVSEVTFREPTGADINRYGNPVRIDQFGEAIIKEREMSMMMSSLSGILLPLFEQMDTRDWNSCAYRLRRFFVPDPAAW